MELETKSSLELCKALTSATKMHLNKSIKELETRKDDDNIKSAIDMLQDLCTRADEDVKLLNKIIKKIGK